MKKKSKTIYFIKWHILYDGLKVPIRVYPSAEFHSAVQSCKDFPGEIFLLERLN